MPQFLISDSDLKNIYDCIKGYGEISDALLLLSKPLDEEIPRERVYEDVLILTLTEGQVEELVTSIADESGSASIMVILARSVKKGLAVRGEEDSDDDEEDDDWNPGDFGHPLNADGTPREARRIEGYCVSCKTLRVFDGYIRIADSGNSLVNGACPVCYTRMSKTV